MKKYFFGILKWLMFVMIFIQLPNAMAAPKNCNPVLWKPGTFSDSHRRDFDHREKIKVISIANKYVKFNPGPVPRLASAGKISVNNPDLVRTRSALSDSGRAAMLALAYKLYPDPRYLSKVQDILLQWAIINHPTGNPIDETRLDGLIWAYDLVSCDLPEPHKMIIEKWFKSIRIKKSMWKLGVFAKNNNHNTHQLKMMLLLDKVLSQPLEINEDIKKINDHLATNIIEKTGETVDYRERTALYYHNFDLEAWLEIGLVSECCHIKIKSAFDFLSERIISQNIYGEFLHSKARIDLLRAKNGFNYAKVGGKFDLSQASKTIVTYYTIDKSTPPKELASIVNKSKDSAWLNFIIYRGMLWN